MGTERGQTAEHSGQGLLTATSSRLATPGRLSQAVQWAQVCRQARTLEASLVPAAWCSGEAAESLS